MISSYIHSFIITCIITLVVFLFGGTGAALTVFMWCTVFDVLINMYVHHEELLHHIGSAWTSVRKLVSSSLVQKRTGNVIFVKF